MSEEKFEDQLQQEEAQLEEMSLDELLESTRDDLENGAPTTFEPSLPPEYADLTNDDDETPPEEEDEETSRIPGVVKGILYVCCVLTVAILLAVVGWKCADDVLALTADDNVVTVTVTDQSTMAEISDQLYDKGLIKYQWLFNLYCMVSNAEEKIDPGTYQLNEQFDYHAMIYSMMETSENRATVTVTVPEGYEAEDIFKMLEENGVCSAADLEEAAAEYEFDYWFLEDLDYGDYRRLEGYLFPDTYEFYVDDNAENVLSRFLRNFDNKFTEEMKDDLNALNEQLRANMVEDGFTEDQIAARMMSAHQVVIVASLVEKETTGVSESGRIASVIYNRLCSTTYPLLNIDATIQYVLPERKEVLTNADKAVVSPYNTYTHVGLPIGPIANPGMSSLRAALHPADTEYYFYALDPINGGHHFSTSVYDHQAFLDSLMGEEEEEAPAEASETDDTTEETDEASSEEAPDGE